MVRFEALDSDGGLLEDASGHPLRTPDAAKLAMLDYWTRNLRQYGIYYYFDLLDLRTFREGDGVPDAARLPRAGRPYSMFDPRLITLQKEYAEELLLHRNPHTGLRYVDDPALAMVEICNESGFFLRPSDVARMPEAMVRILRERWNRWLVQRYGSRDRLAGAWTHGGAGDSALRIAEDPAAGTVELPILDGAGAAGSDARLVPERYADGVRFLIEVQQEYFREMRTYLRSIGLQVPVTGVTSRQYLGDAVSSLPLDFTAGNYYCDHPAFPDGDWQGPLHFADTNPLRETGVHRSAPTFASYRWGRRPVVIREWAQPWPNRYRCVAPAEMAAYGLLQDVDGLLLFGYRVAPYPDRLGDFDYQADPTVWGLMGPAALTFLRGDIRPAPVGVTIRHTAREVLQPPGTIGDALKLAWNVRVRNVFEEWPDASAWKPSVAPMVPVNDVLDSLRSAGLSAGEVTGSAIISAGGQIVRRTDRGVLTVSAPRTAIVAGEIGGRVWAAGPLRVFSASPIGAVWAVSLDGAPLDTSRRFLVKMVTTAFNTNQKTSPAAPGAPAPFRLDASGQAPVITHGVQRQGGLRVAWNNRLALTLDLEGGTWELLVDGGTATLVCDTGGIHGTLLGRKVVTDNGRRLSAPFPKDMGK
jgi:hypothetical protein